MQTASILALVLLGACRPSAPEASTEAPPSPTMVADGSAPATAPVAEGTGTAAASAATDPAPAGADAGAVQAATPAPLPDLVALMRDAGFPDARPDDLARYVPVPPGAIGAAGAFSGNGVDVQVALIRYTNPHYVRPHISDLEERRRVVPQLAEAWAHDATTVVHVKAVDRATADRVCAAIAQRLGWPAP